MLWTKPFYQAEAPYANHASPVVKKALGKMKAVTDEGEHVEISQRNNGRIVFKRHESKRTR